MNSLESVSAIELGFPGEFLHDELARMVIYAGMRDVIEA
jgi:hypothetical protein